METLEKSMALQEASCHYLVRPRSQLQGQQSVTGILYYTRLLRKVGLHTKLGNFKAKLTAPIPKVMGSKHASACLPIMGNTHMLRIVIYLIAIGTSRGALYRSKQCKICKHDAGFCKGMESVDIPVHRVKFI